MFFARVLIIFDWRDGPLEGILRSEARKECWYFKLIAERFEESGPDDRIFGLWGIPNPDASVLVKEFDSPGDGAHVWPVVGGLGSVEAQGIVDEILSSDRGEPTLLVRTPDFSEILGVWDVASH
ncbi:hypothetical protein ACF06X_03285 [Streptomyces sp. NPDC015346]|uniref:hypothetical protein n=1 Tax=Streptomyces sp. NPDC015346 TaxID=3364954 RepID=UPI0036F7C907